MTKVFALNYRKSFFGNVTVTVQKMMPKFGDGRGKVSKKERRRKCRLRIVN